MNVNYNQIIDIKSLKILNNYPINKPIFKKNYIFHYLVLLNNLDGLKLKKFPIYIENSDGLNCFFIAAKESNLEMLYYLIENYSDYIYNRNKNKETFVNYLDFSNIMILLKKYPNIDWNDLILNHTKKTLLNNILENINYEEIQLFIKFLKLENELNKYQYLFSITKNNKIDDEKKIKIFSNYSDIELNIKNDEGMGLILIIINNNNKILFDYLINRNIDIDYYTAYYSYNPLRLAINIDIIYNTNNYVEKILSKLKTINKFFFRDTDKYNENIFHSLINTRLNRNSQILNLKYFDINLNIDHQIFKFADTNSLNKLNIEKISPIDLLIELDYDIYNYVLKEDILIDSRIINNIINKKNIDKRWIELCKKRINKNENIVLDNDIIMDINKYSHCTLFQSTFFDVGFYILYLEDTYKNLLIPNKKFYLINDLTFDGTFPFSDDFIIKEPIFPWVISYYSENEYYIHPYLNIIINQNRISQKKRFCCVFLSIISNNILHANILIYDFKKMIIERFEPYGSINAIDSMIDTVLEEELTWNTGLYYIKTIDYLPSIGFQSISDENNNLNKKSGDFGGFCLAWCIWYLETKLKNIDLDSKILVNKLINKLNNLDIKYSEYIRNYSNKLNINRVNYMEAIGFNTKETSDLYLSNELNQKLINFFINRYNN